MPRKKKQQGVSLGDLENILLRRIDECNELLSHLDNCTAWKIIVKDLEEQRKMIDDNWHMTTDEKKVQEFRITKFAIMHLLNIRNKYTEDLKQAHAQLKSYGSQDKAIIKDYDTETIHEK
jgi:hypothetical protein